MSAQQAAKNTARPLRKIPVLLALGLLAWGTWVAGYLTVEKLRIQYDPGYSSSCNLGQGFNCEAVITSKWGEDPIVGLPISLWGIPTYVLSAFLLIAALAALGNGEKGHERALRAIRIFTLLSSVSLLYSAYLFYVSKMEIGQLCPYCLRLYAVSLGTTVFAFAAQRKLLAPLDLLVSVGRSMLRLASPVPQSVLVFGAALAIALFWYRQSEAHLLARAIRQASINAPASTPGRGPRATTGGGLGATGAGGHPPARAPSHALGTAGQPPRRTASARTSKAVATENGLSFFNAPLRSDDFFWGNPKAPVTIVTFGDFQCSYCRLLDLNFRRIKEKFRKDIRLVFRHYPMNGDCNRRMGGNRMHEHACTAARSAECAGRQGKFWEMHDLLYDNQQHLDPPTVEGHAKKLGLDMGKWKACLSDPAIDQRIQEDVREAARAGIWGTPRTYINGRLVTGAAGPAILEYYINAAKAQAEGGAAAGPSTAEAVAPTASAPRQVEVKLGDRVFYIDAFEASVDVGGRALSIPGSVPARLSWHDARAACEKSGKRLCTEEEWVSACTGRPAIDNNGNHYFADDAVEGWMYPYGAFYERGRCRDAEDKYEGEPGRTGGMAGCRTPTGIYDLAGNLGEWTGTEERYAAQLGGDFRSTERAACNKRSATFGPGIRNKTTGFRCCSDHAVTGPSRTAEEVDTSSTLDVVGHPVPGRFKVATDEKTEISASWFEGKITYITFFASWCGSCKRELPALRKLQEEYGPRGFRVLAIGTDRIPSRSKEFVQKYEPNYTVAYDPASFAMGLFNIDAMPASFLVDRKGRVRHRAIGFKPEDLPEVRQRIEGLLGGR